MLENFVVKQKDIKLCKWSYQIVAKWSKWNDRKQNIQNVIQKMNGQNPNLHLLQIYFRKDQKFKGKNHIEI